MCSLVFLFVLPDLSVFAVDVAVGVVVCVAEAEVVVAVRCG